MGNVNQWGIQEETLSDYTCVCVMGGQWVRRIVSVCVCYMVGRSGSRGEKELRPCDCTSIVAAATVTKRKRLSLSLAQGEGWL